MRRSLLVAFTLASLAAWPRASFAQRNAADVETAREAYRQGLKMREAGDLRGALEKFRAAHALAKTPITGLELCKSHAALAQPVEAREVCLGVSRIPPSSEETARSAEARAEAAKIAEEVKPKIGSIVVVLQGVPPGRTPTVTIDGRAVPPAALSEPRSVNPGTHEIVARIETGPEARSTVETREGEGRRVELTVVAPAAPPPPPPGGPAVPPGWQGGTEPPPKKKSPLVSIGLGVAVVGGAAGLITGFVALNGKSSLDNRCVDNKCGPAEHSALDSARTFGTLATVSFVIAGAGGALALVGLATSPSSTGAAPSKARTATLAPQVHPYLGLGSAGVHGSF
ncbi:MAG: hypothetical protein KC657_11680 [Myxococcales bacterium]|nr:hypothetical protein [Myxococcales bacterium]